jgi:RHS repeat-associated protein
LGEETLDVDALAMRYWDSGSPDGPDTSHYYLQDANYNVTALVRSDGTVAERYAYTPYGTPTILNGASDPDGGAEWSVDTNGSDVKNVYLYTGRDYDWETGLQNSRYRFDASHLGRFLSRDPIGYALGQLNLYSYPFADPVSSKDPFGLDDGVVRWPVDSYPYLPPGNPHYSPDWPWGYSEVYRGCIGLCAERVGSPSPLKAPGIECFEEMSQALVRLAELQEDKKNKPCLFAFQTNWPQAPDKNRGPGAVIPQQGSDEHGIDYLTLHCPEKTDGQCGGKDCWWEHMNHNDWTPGMEVIARRCYPEPKHRKDIFCVVPCCKTPTAGGLGPMPGPPGNWSGPPIHLLPH